MFEELPELETNAFLKNTFRSIGRSDEDIVGFPEKVIWLSDNLWQYFEEQFDNLRSFQQRLVYEIGSWDINLIWQTLLYAKDQYDDKLGEHFFQFRHTIWNEIPATKDGAQSSFIWLYLDWLTSEFLRTKNIPRNAEN